MKLSTIFQNVKKKNPLIQNITNYVTVNDCANILLACGASPVMTDDCDDSSDIAAISDGLTLNIGTLNEQTIKSMISAGKVSSKLNHPIVLDPVGVGVSKIRTDTVYNLIRDLNIFVICGNFSEIKFISDKSESPKGVDSLENYDSLDQTAELFKKLSSSLKCIIVATGQTDIITDGNKVCFCRNGSSIMSKVTGTGCQLSSLITAFVSSNESTFDSSIAAVCSYGICGEIAYSRMRKLDGNSSYRNYIIDAIFNLTPEIIEEKAKYEIQ